MNTYRVYSYDVWGNERDGYDVNDVYRGDTVEINPDKDIVSELRKAGLIKKGIRSKSIGNDGEPGYTWYVTDNRNGRPEFELRFED